MYIDEYEGKLFECAACELPYEYDVLNEAHGLCPACQKRAQYALANLWLKGFSRAERNYLTDCILKAVDDDLANVLPMEQDEYFWTDHNKEVSP